MTDDLLMLSQLDSKMDALARQSAEIDLELKSMDARMRRMERVSGSRWGKIVERGILVALTWMIGWQNIRNEPAVKAALSMEAEGAPLARTSTPAADLIRLGR